MKEKAKKTTRETGNVRLKYCRLLNNKTKTNKPEVKNFMIFKINFKIKKYKKT